MCRDQRGKPPNRVIDRSTHPHTFHHPDSLTFHWFQVLLHRFTTESSSLPPLAIKSEPILRVHQLTLNPAHPFFNILRKRYPYIPLSRFSQPFITFAMADHLFDYDLIATMLEDDFGFQPGWRPDFEGEPRTSDWLSVIKERTDMKGWKSEEDSIIVLNTGAHWTAKPIGFREDLDLLLPIYRRMVSWGEKQNNPSVGMSDWHSD